MTCEVLEKIQMDWRTAEGQNRAAAWSLSRALAERLRQKVEGKLAKDSVDLLITGCEAQMPLYSNKSDCISSAIAPA